MFRIIVFFVFFLLAPLGFCNSIAELRGKVLELGGEPVMEVRSRWVIIIESKKTVIRSRDLYMEDGILVTLRKTKDKGKDWYVHYVGPWPDLGYERSQELDDGENPFPTRRWEANRKSRFSHSFSGGSETRSTIGGIEGRCLVVAGKRVKASL
jgi:hypothetical protein